MTFKTSPRDSTPVSSRGDRLQPSRGDRIYWHLTALRSTIERVVRDHAALVGGDLVDYGCGNLPYRPLFEPHVQKYIAYDLAGNDLADETLRDDGLMDCDAESTSIVLSSQVLEHVVDPAGYLAEARRVLRTGGLLILSTHGVWRYHPDPTDFWRWTCDGLKKTITEAGFEIVEFTGVMGPAATALQLWQDATLPRVPRFLQGAFTWVMQRFITRADLKCRDSERNRDACVYVVVARRR